MTGIGFRRDFAEALISGSSLMPDFVELAPENWMNFGGYWKKLLDKAASQYPVFCHGLSLSIGSPDPVDRDFVKQIKQFLSDYQIPVYSEHLSYSKCDNAHVYDLLPIPFREEAVTHISERIRQVQDILERTLILEIVSYYTPVAAEMTESEFIRAIVSESHCDLLLDINNVYVNGFNHRYDPGTFIDTLPLDRVAYIHMAGHEQVAPDLIIDTHGQAIIDPVYDLFEETLPKLRPVPVLLERDFNIPELPKLQSELEHLRSISTKIWRPEYVPIH